MNANGGKDKFTSEKDLGFPIKVECGMNTTFVDGVAVPEWIVCANGFMLAHFCDEQHMLVYLEYLKLEGIRKLPKKIIEIIRHRHYHNQLGVAAVIDGKEKK